jgi:hypothetical protein
MRLILLPDHPGHGSGGAKLVKSDLARLDPQSDDIVVVRSRDRVQSAGYDQIALPPRLSLPRITNLARFRVSAEMRRREVERYAAYPVDDIFCGGVELYRATRSVFPNHHLTVRFHNLFWLVQSRRREHRYPVDPLFSIYLATYPTLERAIFADPEVSLIFASDADREFHALHFPETPSSVWSIETIINPTVRTPTEPRLVHFGGASVHKTSGLRYFISKVFSDLRVRYPRLELHLHGHGTQRMDNPDKGVFGHGRFDGAGIPHEGDGLFVNPDLLGGGIKIKVGDWLEWGVPFISTPFGVDGYSFEPSSHRMVAAIEDWHVAIPNYFANLGLLSS